MRESKDLINSVRKWADKIGHHEAQTILMEVGLGASTAYRLVSGQYLKFTKTPSRFVLLSIERALKEAS